MAGVLDGATDSIEVMEAVSESIINQEGDNLADADGPAEVEEIMMRDRLVGEKLKRSD